MNEEEKFKEPSQKFHQEYEIRWHSNLDQVGIAITEDRLKLCLYKAIDRLDVKRKWWTPLSVFVTLVLALITTEFKDQFVFSPATWEAIFVISAGITFYLTIKAIWKATRVEVSVESILAEIKQQPPEIADVTAGRRD